MEHGVRAPRSCLDSEQRSSPIRAPESVPPELLGTPLMVWNFCALETGRRARESGEKGGKNWEVEQSVLVSSTMSAFPMASLGEVAKIPFPIFFLHGPRYSAAVQLG